jgi:hypothetical protein
VGEAPTSRTRRKQQIRRDGKLALVDSSLRIRRGDRIEFAVDSELRTQAREWLASAGWVRLDDQ